MHLCKVSDGPHEIAARKSQEDTRPDKPIQAASLAQNLARAAVETYVWLGPFGVANHAAAIVPRTMAKIKSVGNADDMVDDGGRRHV